MSQWLYLSPHATGATPWRCFWWQADGPLHQGNLEQAAADLNLQRLTLLLPMEMASHHQVSVPARSGRWLRQALHSALEEQLIDELDSLHLAHGPLKGKRHCPVLAVNRERLSHCLAQLARFGLRPSRIHIDADCLPQDQPRALAWDSRWLLGGSAPLRQALGDTELRALAPLLPTDLHWQGPCAPALPGIDVQGWHADERPWDCLSQGTPQAINLRQGEFRLHAPQTPAWRLALLMAVIVGSAHLLQSIGQREYLDRQSDQQQAQSQALWQQRFPSEGPVSDLAAQIRAKQQPQVAKITGSAGQLSRLAEHWSASHGALARVHRLDYQAGEGWSLHISAPAFSDLQQLREGLIAQGLDARTESSVRNAQGVSAQLQIKE
ncbi:type II secretion system protein GspL [Pseudomonas sp. MAFF 302046]|jgi:general secretion pathway protein L|uniref:Type II secretion system protein L n=1 Tax=Pseudomonas morbosilactucae TaxID=2938197 RepID=A0ABT0J9N0_9PSED|nr:type II secretion system protein GspL [Pseudomonas morbosilactucae]MCK9812588.1 type II secretion system protein GspL [Pseudomonas morbosilactucae]